MIRIQLDTPTRDQLQAMRYLDLAARVRDRMDMVPPADAGSAAAYIAAYLSYNYRTALGVLKDFLAQGRDALATRRTGPASDLARREQVAGRLRGLLGRDRTWTSA